MGLGVGSGLRLVADNDVAEGEELVDLSLEELGDEGSREVHGEDLGGTRESGVTVSYWSSVAFLVIESHLARTGRALGELESGLKAVGEEEASEVEELSLVDEGLNLGGVEVVDGERLRGAEGRAEGTVRPPVSERTEKRREPGQLTGRGR